MTTQSYCILGANGFVGRNLVNHLRHHAVLGVTRAELDLQNADEVDAFFAENAFDVVVNCAAVGGSRLKEDDARTYDSNMSSFMHVAKHAHKFKRLVWLSSGAALNAVVTQYGASKADCEKLAYKIPNLQVWRVYGCFGVDELPSRFIATCLREKHVTIHEDRLYDFFWVCDLCTLIEKYETVDGTIRDAVYEKKYKLSEIAELYGVPFSNITVLSGSGKPYVGKFEQIVADVIGVKDRHAEFGLLSRNCESIPSAVENSS